MDLRNIVLAICKLRQVAPLLSCWLTCGEAFLVVPSGLIDFVMVGRECHPASTCAWNAEHLGDAGLGSFFLWALSFNSDAALISNFAVASSSHA